MTTEKFKIEILPLKNKLFRMAFRLLRNQQEAEDTTQEVFLRLWDKREKLTELKNVEAFAVTITKNLCFDKLKLKSNKNNELLEFNLKEEKKDPEEETEMKDTVNIIHQIIDHLPHLQRMAIQLRDIEGYEFEEIADILNLNTNAVRVNLSRARKKVRDELIKAQRYEFSRN